MSPKHQQSQKGGSSLSPVSIPSPSLSPEIKRDESDIRIVEDLKKEEEREKTAS